MTGNEKLLFTEDGIFIEEDRIEAVMHNGEMELMRVLANIVTKNGGNILEVGFGLHLSADEIQKNESVKSHTIIEIHPEIYEKALIWAKDKPKVKIILGDWFEVIPTLDQKFDGILHDTHRDSNISHFLKTVKRLCNRGCIVGFFTNPYRDESLNTLSFRVSDEDFSRLPYRGTQTFNLKYTTFNGIEFVK